MLEVLKQALRTLEYIDNVYMSVPKLGHEAITSLRKAIAELESQEPVAWRTFDGESQYEYRAYEDNEDYGLWWEERHPNHKNWVEPLYTHPPQRTWVGLTDEEIDLINGSMCGEREFHREYAKAIEAKLKEKNT